MTLIPTCRMMGHENKAWRHHTCVTNVLFALREPHAELCLGGCMHDCASTLSTTSTPCAYLHTQSCLVSLGLQTSSSPFEIHRLSGFFTATCVSHQCWLSLSASLRRRGRDLRVSVYDVIFWQAKVRYVSWSHIPKLCWSICVVRHFIQLERICDCECLGAVQVAGY